MTQMTPILVRMPPELLAQIDDMRGDVPRAVFVRRCCERTVGEPKLGMDEPSKRMKAALDAMRIIEELPIEQRLPADKVAAMKKAASPKAAPEPFKSRLKGEWKAP